jgi:TolA-binding protein
MMIAGSIGRPRGEQISWLLALCKHELAEQQQRRFDIQSKTSVPTPLAQQDRLNKWKDCESAWRRYLEEFPAGAGAPHGKLLWGYALANLDDKEAAINAWQDVSRPMATQEKAARLFLAKSLKDKK